ncbi:MAG: TetR/AcrR family transcriptional regulator [Enterococcus sp.]
MRLQINLDKNSVKKSILEAFLYLLSVHKYEDITVYEIVEHAYVSRVTFYKYFKNKDALLAEVINRLQEEFRTLLKWDTDLLNQFSMSRKKDVYIILYPYTYRILDYFRSKQKLINRLCKMNHQNLDFIEVMHKTYHDYFVQVLPEPFYAALNDSTIEYYSLFMTNGVFSIIEKWFKANFEESIDDVIDKILVLLITNLSALYLEVESQAKKDPQDN